MDGIRFVRYHYSQHYLLMFLLLSLSCSQGQLSFRHAGSSGSGRSFTAAGVLGGQRALDPGDGGARAGVGYRLAGQTDKVGSSVSARQVSSPRLSTGFHTLQRPLQHDTGNLSTGSNPTSQIKQASTLRSPYQPPSATSSQSSHNSLSRPRLSPSELEDMRQLVRHISDSDAQKLRRLYANIGSSQPFRDFYNSHVLELRAKASLAGKPPPPLPLWSLLSDSGGGGLGGVGGRAEGGSGGVRGGGAVGVAGSARGSHPAESDSQGTAPRTRTHLLQSKPALQQGGFQGSPAFLDNNGANLQGRVLGSNHAETTTYAMHEGFVPSPATDMSATLPPPLSSQQIVPGSPQQHSSDIGQNALYVSLRQPDSLTVAATAVPGLSSPLTRTALTASPGDVMGAPQPSSSWRVQARLLPLEVQKKLRKVYDVTGYSVSFRTLLNKALLMYLGLPAGDSADLLATNTSAQRTSNSQEESQLQQHQPPPPQLQQRVHPWGIPSGQNLHQYQEGQKALTGLVVASSLSGDSQGDDESSGSRLDPLLATYLASGVPDNSGNPNPVPGSGGQHLVRQSFPSVPNGQQLLQNYTLSSGMFPSSNSIPSLSNGQQMIRQSYPPFSGAVPKGNQPLQGYPLSPDIKLSRNQHQMQSVASSLFSSVPLYHKSQNPRQEQAPVISPAVQNTTPLPPGVARIIRIPYTGPLNIQPGWKPPARVQTFQNNPAVVSGDGSNFVSRVSLPLTPLNSQPSTNLQPQVQISENNTGFLSEKSSHGHPSTPLVSGNLAINQGVSGISVTAGVEPSPHLQGLQGPRSLAAAEPAEIGGDEIPATGSVVTDFSRGIPVESTSIQATTPSSSPSGHTLNPAHTSKSVNSVSSTMQLPPLLTLKIGQALAGKVASTDPPSLVTNPPQLVVHEASSNNDLTMPDKLNSSSSELVQLEQSAILSRMPSDVASNATLRRMFLSMAAMARERAMAARSEGKLVEGQPLHSSPGNVPGPSPSPSPPSPVLIVIPPHMVSSGQLNVSSLTSLLTGDPNALVAVMQGEQASPPPSPLTTLLPTTITTTPAITTPSKIPLEPALTFSMSLPESSIHNVPSHDIRSLLQPMISATLGKAEAQNSKIELLKMALYHTLTTDPRSFIIVTKSNRHKVHYKRDDDGPTILVEELLHGYLTGNVDMTSLPQSPSSGLVPVLQFEWMFDEGTVPATATEAVDIVLAKYGRIPPPPETTTTMTATTMTNPAPAIFTSTTATEKPKPTAETVTGSSLSASQEAKTKRLIEMLKALMMAQSLSRVSTEAPKLAFNNAETTLTFLVEKPATLNHINNINNLEPAMVTKASVTGGFKPSPPPVNYHVSHESVRVQAVATSDTVHFRQGQGSGVDAQQIPKATGAPLVEMIIGPDAQGHEKSTPLIAPPYSQTIQPLAIVAPATPTHVSSEAGISDNTPAISYGSSDDSMLAIVDGVSFSKPANADGISFSKPANADGISVDSKPTKSVDVGSTTPEPLPPNLSSLNQIFQMTLANIQKNSRPGHLSPFFLTSPYPGVTTMGGNLGGFGGLWSQQFSPGSVEASKGVSTPKPAPDKPQSHTGENIASPASSKLSTGVSSLVSPQTVIGILTPVPPLTENIVTPVPSQTGKDVLPPVQSQKDEGLTTVPPRAIPLPPLPLPQIAQEPSIPLVPSLHSPVPTPPRTTKTPPTFDLPFNPWALDIGENTVPPPVHSSGLKRLNSEKHLFVPLSSSTASEPLQGLMPLEPNNKVSTSTPNMLENHHQQQHEQQQQQQQQKQQQPVTKQTQELPNSLQGWSPSVLISLAQVITNTLGSSSSGAVSSSQAVNSSVHPPNQNDALQYPSASNTHPPAVGMVHPHKNPPAKVAQIPPASFFTGQSDLNTAFHSSIGISPTSSQNLGSVFNINLPSASSMQNQGSVGPVNLQLETIQPGGGFPSSYQLNNMAGLQPPLSHTSLVNGFNTVLPQSQGPIKADVSKLVSSPPPPKTPNPNMYYQQFLAWLEANFHSTPPPPLPTLPPTPAPITLSSICPPNHRVKCGPVRKSNRMAALCEIKCDITTANCDVSICECSCVTTVAQLSLQLAPKKITATTTMMVWAQAERMETTKGNYKLPEEEEAD